MIRSFLAIDLPEEIKTRLAGQIRILSPGTSGIKWVETDRIHLTLKFFGSVPRETLDRLSEVALALSREFQPFRLSLRGVGGFPHIRRPRVIWAGLGQDLETLQKLVGQLEAGYGRIGIPPEDRPFHPHLTLGRNKTNQPNEKLFQRLSGWAEEESEPFWVQELILFQSALQPAGPIYSKICSFPLPGK
jgi:RNA 2',3'-cyclic 3'-phosphodiesterase